MTVDRELVTRKLLPQKVFESLQSARDDVVTYVRAVEAYLDRPSER